MANPWHPHFKDMLTRLRRLGPAFTPPEPGLEHQVVQLMAAAPFDLKGDAFDFTLLDRLTRCDQGCIYLCANTEQGGQFIITLGARERSKGKRMQQILGRSGPSTPTRFTCSATLVQQHEGLPSELPIFTADRWLAQLYPTSALRLELQVPSLRMSIATLDDACLPGGAIRATPGQWKPTRHRKDRRH